MISCVLATVCGPAPTDLDKPAKGQSIFRDLGSKLEVVTCKQKKNQESPKTVLSSCIWQHTHNKSSIPLVVNNDQSPTYDIVWPKIPCLRMQHVKFHGCRIEIPQITQLSPLWSGESHARQVWESRFTSTNLLACFSGEITCEIFLTRKILYFEPVVSPKGDLVGRE